MHEQVCNLVPTGTTNLSFHLTIVFQLMPLPAYMKNSLYKMEMYSGWHHPDNIPSKAAIRKKQKSDYFRYGNVAYGGYDMIFYPIDGGFYPNDGDFGSGGCGGGDDFVGGGRRARRDSQPWLVGLLKQPNQQGGALSNLGHWRLCGYKALEATPCILPSSHVL